MTMLYLRTSYLGCCRFKLQPQSRVIYRLLLLPSGARSSAQHGALLDILSVLVRCTPTSHVQRTLDLCAQSTPYVRSVLVLVFLALYILVGKSFWYN